MTKLRAAFPVRRSPQYYELPGCCCSFSSVLRDSVTQALVAGNGWSPSTRCLGSEKQGFSNAKARISVDMLVPVLLAGVGRLALRLHLHAVWQNGS